MAASTSTSGNNWLHHQLQKVMGPALIILIGSSIFRGILGLVIASLTNSLGSYSNWSPLIKLPIEIVVFLGVFISSDVCFAATVTNCESEKKRRNTIAREEMPRFKGTPDQVQTQTAAWQKQHDQAIDFAKEELGTEKKARLFFGFVSISYAFNFILQSAVKLSPDVNNILLLVVDTESIIVGIYVIWYYSARYKAEKPDPEEKSEGLIVTAVDKRLDLVADHFEAGQPDEQDLNLAEAGLAKGHHYRKFVAALRIMPAKDQLLSTNDIFDVLHLEDLGDATEIQTAQRKIRRIISAAYTQHVQGVFRDQTGGRTTWHVDGEAFYRLFGDFMKNGQVTDKRRTSGARKRPSRFTATGQAPDASSIPAVQQTLPEAPQAPAASPEPPPQVIAGTTYAPPTPDGLQPATV